MTFSRISIYALGLLMLAITPVQAKEYCDKPINLREFKKPVPGYCNVYDRQLAYREERIKFREMIEERRKEYIKPQIAAEKDYEKKLEALNNSRSHENDVTGIGGN
jgi:hypothetical protein